MNVFIDANVLLSFYGLAPHELEELRKLGALIEAGDIVLWLPDQVRDEFVRNRPKVLAEALKALRDSRIRVVLPEISRNLEQSEALETAVQATNRAHSDLLKTLETAIDSKELEADKIIEDLFGKANSVSTRELVQRARHRRDLRRPPGKSDSLGDAVNWEALLEAVPEGEDIHIVSSDGDFRSPLGNYRMSEVLESEWEETKMGTARLYRDLGAFSTKHFPELALATDVKKLRSIRSLATSPSFADTHRIIAQLSEFSLFTPDQARLLIHAAASNSQVRWIASDEDVFALLRRVIDAHRARLDENDVAALEREMHPPAPPEPSDDDDDLPF